MLEVMIIGKENVEGNIWDEKGIPQGRYMDLKDEMNETEYQKIAQQTGCEANSSAVVISKQNTKKQEKKSLIKM